MIWVIVNQVNTYFLSFLAFFSRHVQCLRCYLVAGNSAMGVVQQIIDFTSKPVIASCIFVFSIQALLDDCPVSLFSYEEIVLV